jgi:hypothetical protein
VELVQQRKKGEKKEMGNYQMVGMKRERGRYEKREG